MSTNIAKIPIFLACATALGSCIAHGQEPKEIGRTTEKELKVVVNASFGSLHIARGEPAKVVVMESRKKKSGEFNYDYSIRNRVGYMDLTLGEGENAGGSDEGGKFHFSDLSSGDWVLQFSDAIPISFDLELGVGKGDINLSGLKVKDLNLSTGASDVCLAFDEANTSMIENLNIEAGVSKFVGRSLGNANFRHFRFQGGVGTFKLDFSGEQPHEVDLDVSVGMGLLTMVIPSDIGVRVSYEKNWISRVSCPEDFNSNGDTEFVSSNFDGAKGKMIIRVESGVGSVKIVRAD